MAFTSVNLKEYIELNRAQNWALLISKIKKDMKDNNMKANQMLIEVIKIAADDKTIDGGEAAMICTTIGRVEISANELKDEKK